MSKDENKPRTFKRTGLKVQVFQNRVEVTEGLPPLRSKEVIPMSNIASVDVTKATRTVVIKTNDGKEHKLRIGGVSPGGISGRKSFQLRDAIAERI